MDVGLANEWHSGPMTDRRTAIWAAVVLLAVGGAAYVVGRQSLPRPASAAAATTATLTITGATANIYGARATETIVGQPMPLTALTDTVVVVIEATDGIGSCEIDANGVRVAYASTSQGQQAVCVWNRREPTA